MTNGLVNGRRTMFFKGYAVQWYQDMFGGVCLCFGWNTNGIGKGRGFEMTDILIVAHGGSKNDTLCTREVKVLDHPTEKGGEG